MEKLLRNNTFSSLSDEEQLLFIKTFWKVLGQIVAGAFELKTSKEYMTLKSLGLYTLNWIAFDILKEFQQKGLDVFKQEDIYEILKPLESFDWNIQTSPLSKLGGMKGVNEAHRILLETLSNEEQEKKSFSSLQSSKNRQLEEFLVISKSEN